MYEAIGVFFITLFRRFKIDPGNNINSGLNSNMFSVIKPSVLKIFFFRNFAEQNRFFPNDQCRINNYI